MNLQHGRKSLNLGSSVTLDIHTMYVTGLRHVYSMYKVYIYIVYNTYIYIYDGYLLHMNVQCKFC